MPGIAGIISHRPAEECQRLVKAMVASMVHEPFYVSGACSVPELGIHAGWVAHENSFAASQAFWNEGRDVALIFAGECNLDSQTGAELRQKNHQAGDHKPDWLVHLYEEEGEDFFQRLNGLFSGLLIDRRQKKAFLFNDRYGVERIYWHEAKDGFYFASEAKALLRVRPELRAFDETGVAEYLAYGCPLEQRTLFRGVSLLPGASLWSFTNGNRRPASYFSPDQWEKQPVLAADDFASKFEETFKRVLPRYFESETPVGISLTAGLDCRMIMACLPHSSNKPVTYTFGAETGETLDMRQAGRVAKACGLEHQAVRLGRDFISNFAAHADRTVYITDGSLGILGAHEIYLNRMARRLASVRLTGVFGGEILRGVCMFKPLGLAPQLVNRQFARPRDLPQTDRHPVTFSVSREIPWLRFGPPAAGRSQLIFRTPYLDNELVALAYQAPEILRTSSLPATRLIEANRPALSRIPTDMGELGGNHGWAAMPRRVFSKTTFKLDYYCSEGLPRWLSPLDPMFRSVNSGMGIRGLHKFLNYRNWFQRELAGYVGDILTGAQVRECPFWNSGFLVTLAREHARGRANFVKEINAVLALEAVERLLFRDLSQALPPVDAAPTPCASLSPAAETLVANRR